MVQIKIGIRKNIVGNYEIYETDYMVCYNTTFKKEDVMEVLNRFKRNEYDISEALAFMEKERRNNAQSKHNTAQEIKN